MRNAFRGLCAFAALISLITLPMTAQGEPTRHWLITSHSQLSTNQVENQESDENGIFNISPSQEKRYFDVNRIGLTDGDPVKDNKIPEGERYGGDVGKPWMTANISANLEDKNYLEVDLGDGIDLGDDDLVFYLKRYALDKEEHPTGLRIVAGNNDSEFKAKFDSNGLIESFEDADIVGYAYFQYRGTNKSYSEADKDKAGNGTKEYSARIDLGDYRAKFNTTEADRYTKLRIYFTANNTKKRIKKADGTNSDNRTAKLLSFNIMQLGKDENYSDILVDRFHLVTDYSYKYYYHDFIPTLGIFDPHNQYQTVVGVPNHPGLEFKANVHMKDYTKFPSRADYPDYIGDPNSPWVEFSDSKGSGIKWNKDLEYLKLIDFEMPEYRWVENVNDNRISKNKVVTNKGKKPTDVKNRRQPVHVVEHELYAIPGDPIALYPFYELANDYRVDSDNTPNRYALKFAHWYNYRTGGNVTDETGKIDYLDFLVDPSLICKSKDFGYYGGMAISRYTKYDSNPGSVAPVDPDYVESTIKDDDTGTEIITYTKETKDGETITATDKKYIVKINSAAGLAKFASDFNSGVYSTNGTNTVSELTVQLGAVGTPEEGLDFTNIPVTAIGNDSNPFSGKFEGRWVALKNYNVEGAEYGIFGKLGENAVINRLYAENKGADGSKQYVKIDTTDGKRTTDTKTESSTVDIDLVQIKSVGSDGTEKESSKMIIKTVEGLIDFQQRFNKGEISSTVNVELLSGKVYNFDGKTFEPIGTKDYPFAGAFNGKGATISNLVIDDGSMPEVGMFGYVKGGATVKSFCLDASCKFIGEHNVAPIAHLTKNDINDAVVISNIITYAEVYRKTWSTDYVGGIFGYQDNTAVTVRDCVVAGTVKADNNNGAFIGYTSGNASIGNTIAIGIYDIMWSDFLFAGGDNIVYENCYEYAVKGDNIKNISSDSKISTDNKNGINLFEKKDGELYFGDIKVNSDEFAAMLGEDWQVVDGVLSPLKNAADETGSSSSAIEFEIPKPIIDQEKKPDPVEPVEPPVEEPEKRIDYDDVENLAKISDTVYNGIMAGSDDDPRNYPEADEAYSTANKYAKLYKYGAVATFLCPRSTKSDAKGEMENLPEDATAEGNDKDYIIAADFASLFEHVAHPNLNIDNENEALYEPQITFRHLFRIKDGKKFAEDFSGSPSKNEEYVTKHRRVITARSNSKKFQIRLDCPVPRQIEGVIPPPSKYYYKISDTDYRRVRSSRIEVYILDDNGNIISENINMNPNALKDASGNSTGIRFDFGEDYTKIDGSVNGGVFSEYNGFLGYGARIFDGTEYAICGGGGEYYRMIRGINANCGNSDKPDKEIPTGRYLVRLIGMDVNGNDIPVYNATGEADRKLVTQEFEVIVVDDTQANMVTKVEALAKDSEGLDLDDKLAVKFGNPIVNIDFDQYRYLTLTDSKSGVSDLTDYFNTKDGDKTNINFKWPEKWSDVTYGYGYDVKNYEMSGSGGKYGTYSFNYNIYLIANNTSMIPYATANGNLNDITYYKTKNTEEPTSGFFFWVNAASDPGIAAKLKIDKLCTGSTIHVSAYMAEVSNPIKSETANVAFNFVAVSAKGERKTIHTFVSGYVPNPGDWYRVYYQFMPDFNIIKDINDDPDFDIDHFEIELENNCKNSESADYAIDEISVYIVRPSVEAEQIDLICEDAVAVTCKSCIRLFDVHPKRGRMIKPTVPSVVAYGDVR